MNTAYSCIFTDLITKKVNLSWDFILGPAYFWAYGNT